MVSALARIWESAAEATTSGGSHWVDAVTQGVVTVAAALVIAAILGAVRWGRRVHDRFEVVEQKLEGVNVAVNKTEGETLTKRVDCILRTVTEAAEERRRIANRVGQMESTLGEYPPLTVEQARGIARHRAGPGPDNPEEHE